MKKYLNVIWQYKSIAVSHFLACLGVLLSIYELIGIVWSVPNQCVKIIICALILIISIGYSLYRLLCKKKELTLEINKRTK